MPGKVVTNNVLRYICVTNNVLRYIGVTNIYFIFVTNKIKSFCMILFK